MPPEWIGKLNNNKKQDTETNVLYMEKCKKDYMMLDKPNSDLKVIHFASPNATIHNSKYKWIKEYWK